MPRIANIRQDSLHQLTTDLTRRFHTIGIEDLNVSGMVKNRHLSRAISDMGFFEFRRQLEYKAEMRGAVVVVADRFFASSKTCSAPGCGHKVDKLPLSVREWTCPVCGAVHDRDVKRQEFARIRREFHGVCLWRGRLWLLGASRRRNQPQ